MATGSVQNKFVQNLQYTVQCTEYYSPLSKLYMFLILTVICDIQRLTAMSDISLSDQLSCVPTRIQTPINGHLSNENTPNAS